MTPSWLHRPPSADQRALFARRQRHSASRKQQRERAIVTGGLHAECQAIEEGTFRFSVTSQLALAHSAARSVPRCHTRRAGANQQRPPGTPRLTRTRPSAPCRSCGSSGSRAPAEWALAQFDVVAVRASQRRCPRDRSMRASMDESAVIPSIRALPRSWTNPHGIASSDAKCCAVLRRRNRLSPPPSLLRIADKSPPSAICSSNSRARS
jgi:hypothetical protein